MVAIGNLVHTLSVLHTPFLSGRAIVVINGMRDILSAIGVRYRFNFLSYLSTVDL